MGDGRLVARPSVTIAEFEAQGIAAGPEVFTRNATRARLRNSMASASASATEQCRFRRSPSAASQIAIGEVAAPLARSRAAISAANSGSRDRIATIAEASTTITIRR